MLWKPYVRIIGIAGLGENFLKRLTAVSWSSLISSDQSYSFIALGSKSGNVVLQIWPKECAKSTLLEAYDKTWVTQLHWSNWRKTGDITYGKDLFIVSKYLTLT